MEKLLAILTLLSLPPLLLGAPVNLALRGVASGSTEGFGAVFADANDGNRDGQFYTGGSVFHTALPDTTAFWEVDMGETFYLDHIRLYPRTDELQGTVLNFRIRVFDGASNEVFSRSFLPTAAANNAWGTVAVRGVAGRRVRIERMSASPQWMTFAEFEVWGDLVPPGTNLARGKPVTSSPSASGGLAEHGNDGDIDGDYNHPGNPIYHSGLAAPGQFWQVDLQSTNEIDRLGIFLRADFNNTSLVRLTVLDGALRPVYTATQNISAAIFELGARRFAVTHRPPAGIFGRHVRIETLNSEYLTFGEVEVFGVPPDFTPPGAFFGTSTTWKLFRGRSDASTPDATAWRQPTFDDSSWSNAPAPFLYTTASNEPPFWDGGPFRGTLLNDMLNTYSCVFLRKTFVVTNISRLARLDLAAASDDGFIAWLNGVEVARRNMPLSPIAFSGFANLPVTEPTAITTNTIPVATGLVSLGTNVLAVQAFNAALSSSDFGFMAMLAAVRDERPPLLTEQVPSPGEVVAQLTEIEVAFDEPVIGLEAGDLLVSGLPATGLIPIGPGGYRFTFAQPAEGTVNVSFAAGHGITDEVGNGFAGGSWQYILSTNLPPARAIITEFLADNRGGLTDEDGDSEDWIEIYNPGPLRVNLRGWYLSDTSNTLAKWRFPATNLAAEAFMIVFASGKDRTNAGPLHTNFRLDADGGYLALVRPDGASIASEFHYGNQRENFSFGLGRALSPTPLLASTSAVRVLIPPDDFVGNWTGGAEPFDDSAWRAGSMGVGFDQSTGPAASLLAWWDFNTASNSTVALDASGRGHNGAIVTATFTANSGGRTGLPGDRAMNFAGAGYVQIPDAATGLFDTALSNDAVTLSLWIYGDASQPQPGGVFYGSSLAGAAGDRSLNAHLPWTDSVIYWDTGCCESTRHRVAVGAPDPAKWRGRWNHYAFTKNGDIKEIWQNGVRILEGISTANLLPVRSFYIGTYAPGALTYRGRIDDFAVWDRALGAQEIEALGLGQTPLNVQRLTRFITTDVGAAMRGVNASAWVRAAFVRHDSATPDVLLLRTRYDDGFIAYLNGTEIARRNAPPTPASNAAATARRPAGTTLVPEEIDVSRFASALRPGTNVVAFHALNASASEAEFLIQAELVAGQLIPNRFFAEPTPGQTNAAGTAGFVADTKFSIDRGFYAVPFTTGITCATPGATIVFTRDGSEPSLANGTAVAAPDAATGPVAIVNITNTTILRAAAFKPDYHPANIDTHTYLFPARVAAQRRPSGVGPAWPDGAPADFEIDPRIVASALPGYSFTNALLSISTLSLVTSQEGLFGSGRGIYAHSEGRGDEWERAVSAEWMYPDGREGFQVNAGLRIHGNISRQNSFTPKHSFSLFFRGRYGPTKLEFPLFPGSPVREFDMLVLRGGSTDTWPCTEWNTFFVDGVLRWNRAEASYVRDQWVRDAQIAMGQPSSHGAFAHLYLNGLYWGIYDVCERPDEDFNATHVGGQDTDYDVIFDFGEVQAGSKDTWNQMNGMSGSLANDANYMRLLGNDPDGTRNTNFPVLLDVTNLVDYMIVHIFIGADDWPNHNWWAARHRGPDSTGFKFFAWDQEISISSLIRQHSSWGPIYAEANAPDTPAQIYSGLRQNAEFRVFFGDRVYNHLFNDGPLSVSNNLARWDMRMTEIDRAVVAESARWGDYQRPAQPYRREVEWLASNRWMRATFWPSNHHVALRRFRDAGLYPLINPPTVSQFGGSVPAGFSVSLSNPNNSGAILFTIDGSDPRLRGGAVSARAQSYALPITINERTVLRARVKDGPAWSALAEATFHTPQDFSALQLSELHYNPPMFQQIDGDEYEFLELRNTGAVPLDLSNVAFTQGLAFTFPNGTRIAAGRFLILARNPPRFATRFELPLGIAVLGPYSARLDNGGETITLTHPLGDTIFSLRYDDRAPWPEGADGPGPSLHRVNNLAAANSTNWAAATPTPGAPPPAEIVDTDGDGMPDLWESAHGLQPLTNDAAADADFDGLSNLGEYLAGTDPADPDSGLRITAVQLADGGASVVLTFHASAGRSYTIQWRTTLDAGEWLPILNLQALPEPSSMTVTNSVPSSGTSFFRLAVP